MLDWILHLLGLCNDAHSHLDLKDVLLSGTSSDILHTVKHCAHCIWCKLKDWYVVVKSKMFPRNV